MIRTSLRTLVLTGLAGTLLAGCATGYTYRAGPGDSYYGQPEVHYNDPYWYGGYGGWGGWGWYGPYGGYPGYPYGPYWGPYWGPHHVYRPVVRPPHVPPSHGPHDRPGDGTGRRDLPPRPMEPGRPVHPVPTPRNVVVPHVPSGMSERDHRPKMVP